MTDKNKQYKQLKELKIVANRLLQNFTTKRFNNFVNRFEEVAKNKLPERSKMSVVIIKNLAKDFLKINMIK